MSNPTIRDVAKKAGVGVGTVSRVLNNNANVTGATRELVLQAIDELGFRPDRVARQLPRKTRVHNIGVITQPFVNYEAFAERMRGVQVALNAQRPGYELVLYSASSLTHFNEQLTGIVQADSVDGLIIIDLDLTPAQLRLLRTAKIPFVGINHFQGYDWPCIGTDDVEGGYQATRALLDLGHREIAYLADSFDDPFQFTTSQERYEGYRRALEEAGAPLREAYVRLGLHDYDAARGLALELLSLPQRPTAVFAMCDLFALAFLDAARSQGLRIPEDVSVIGFDDIAMSYHVGLSTVRQHFELTGRLALEHLLRLIAGEDAELPKLPPLEVVMRQTTRAL